MTNDELDFLDCTKGLFSQALHLFENVDDGCAIWSGCILLTVGLEKLVKHALEVQSPLLVVNNITIEHACRAAKGEKLGREQTVNITEAFRRLVEIFPSLKQEGRDMNVVANERNFLIHQAGCFDLSKTERIVRIDVVDISEAICRECLGSPPEEILGDEIWEQIVEYRDEYRIKTATKMKQKIVVYKEIFAEGRMLPHMPVTFSAKALILEYECPVCDGMVKIEMDVEFDYDHDGDEWSTSCPYPFLSQMECPTCGLSATDPDEIESLLGTRAVNELFAAGYECEDR